MGRRKIAIRAIKDDRNRSVTFLKRKGGLFKKAHELSVLCSVDVAVIIFGQNKKLYEFSSGDIRQTVSRYQYYGPPHEHKGPADFMDKGGAGDDDDEDEDMAPPSPQPQEQSPPHHGVPHQIQSQPGMQHMRDHRAPSASQSPPMPNGSFQPHRLSTPQPGGISRPDSRTHIRRTSSNLVPQHHPHPQASQMMNHPQMQYGYHQQQQQQHPQHQAQAQQHQHAPQHAPFYQQQQQMQGHPQQHTPPMQHQHHQQQQQSFTTQAPPNAHMQQMYMPDQQHRVSLPPHMQHEGAPMASMHASPPPSRPFQSPPLPGGPGPTQPPPHRPDGGAYSREALPQQWHPTAAATMPVKTEEHAEDIGPARPQSIDVGAAMRYNVNDQPNSGRYGPPPAPPPSAPLRPPLRTGSTGGPAPPAPVRVNSMASDAKRPQLKVTIPGGEESGTAESPSPKDTNKTSTTTPAKPGASETSHSSSLVLPAPSPRSASAGAILSAGATGPTNPFARPNLPKKDASNTEWGKDGIASPMSALPSRVMAESGYMSSPSSMFPELGFGPMHGNTLASPAVYQPTPVNYHGPSFRDEPADKKDDKDKDKDKRPRSGDEAEAGPSKKPKT